MLIGEYRHNFDDKNRISLPAKFRKEVGKTVVVTRGLDKCLYVFTETDWAKMVEEVREPGIGVADKRKMSRYFLGSATDLSVDSLGRILIPEHLRKFADLKSKAVFAGLSNRIEVWGESRWDKYTGAVESDADAVAERLSDIGAV